MVRNQWILPAPAGPTHSRVQCSQRGRWLTDTEGALLLYPPSTPGTAFKPFFRHTILTFKVYFKRKSVPVPQPTHLPTDPTCPVWVIEPTLEYFVSYDKYLERMDFYNQKRFICELTGTSCLTFLEALAMEARESELIVKSFPEALREPILRHVQFSTMSRLDQLVDRIYVKMQHEYYPGETVYYRFRDHKTKCVVKERAAPAPGSDPAAEPEYFLQMTKDLVSPSQTPASKLSRDRRAFSKLTIRTFIKHAASRENWAGAPWIVRPEYVAQYDLPNEMPASIKLLVDQRSSGSAINGGASNRRQNSHRQATPSSPASMNQPMNSGGLSADTPEPRKRRNNKTAVTLSEDLALLVTKRAAESPVPEDPWPQWTVTDEDTELVGPLLEIWSFITTYSDLFYLEPIQFDTFVSALKGEGQESVVSEIHSALLTLLVDEDEDVLAFSLPTQDEPVRRRRRKAQKLETSTPSSQNGDDSRRPSDEEQSEEEQSDHEQAEEEATNNAGEYIEISDRSWLEVIGHRHFGGGTWQQALISLLYYLDYMREWKDDIEEALTILAPLDREGTLLNAIRGYEELPFRLRVACLRILCRTLYTSPPVRQYMEKRSEEVSRARKLRTERFRELRQARDNHKAALELKNNLFLAGDGESEEALVKISDDFAQAVEREKELSKLVEELEAAVEEVKTEPPAFDVHRIKLLGKDRFYNRYWWMEAAGPNSVDESTDPESFTYLMGRLWVQGPSSEDFNVFIASKEADAELTAIKQKAADEVTETKRAAERAAAERAGIAARAIARAKALHEAARLREREREDERQRQLEEERQQREKEAKLIEEKESKLEKDRVEVQAASNASPAKLDQAVQAGVPAQPLQQQGAPQPVVMQQPMGQQLPGIPFMLGPGGQPMYQFVPGQPPMMGMPNPMQGQQPMMQMMPQMVQMPGQPMQMSFVRPQVMYQTQYGMVMYPQGMMPVQYPYGGAPMMNGQMPMQMNGMPNYQMPPVQMPMQPPPMVQNATPPVSTPAIMPPVPTPQPASEPAKETSTDVDVKVESKEQTPAQVNGGGQTTDVDTEQAPGAAEPAAAADAEVKSEADEPDVDREATVECTFIPKTETKSDSGEPMEQVELASEQVPHEEVKNEPVEPVNTLELKKSTEGETVLIAPNEWRYYSTAAQLAGLERYLARASRREGQLAEVLQKMRPLIIASFEHRDQWLEKGSEWSNTLAVKELGHVHCRRRRGQR